MPLVSVILDARTAGAKLPRSLSIFRQAAKCRRGGCELLIMDDTGDHRLPALAQRHQASLLNCNSVPLGRRLNAAVNSSRGEILLFPGTGTPRMAEWLEQRLTEEELGGRWDAAVLSLRAQGWLWRWRLLQRFSPLDTFWITRAWFERIGGFDHQLERDALPDLLDRLQACGARVTIEKA